MSDHQSVNALNNVESSKLNPKEAEQKQSAEEDTQAKCLDSLKNSVDKSTNQLNKDQAIEKLNFTKETVESTDLKLKIDNLVETIKQTNPKEMVELTRLQSMITEAFQKQVTFNQEISEGLAVTLNAEKNNPFKLDNPFAPKIITKTKEASQKERPTKQEEEAKPEPFSLMKVLKKWF